MNVSLLSRKNTSAEPTPVEIGQPNSITRYQREKTNHVSNLSNTSTTTHVAQSRCHLSPPFSVCVKLPARRSHVVRKFARTHARLPHRPFLCCVCEIPLVFLNFHRIFVQHTITIAIIVRLCMYVVISPVVGDLLVGQRPPSHFGSQVRACPSPKAHVCVGMRSERLNGVI